MKLPALLCSDPHFTAAPADEYRWGFLPWLVKEVLAKNGVKSLAILGDLTDAKDYHSAQLVNRVATSLVVPTWIGLDVFVLMGNHDYLKGGQPYFAFLNEIPKIKYISKIEDTAHMGESVLWLPHSRNPAAEWKDKAHCFADFRYIMMHQTIKGAKASNGQLMDGEDLPDLSGLGNKIYSGDIHVPQVIGPIEYVGSPYHVHFGDRFRPRCILLREDGTTKDFRYPTINRMTVDVESVEDLAAERLHPGDQVKVRAHLQRHELHEWLAIRRRLAEILAKKEVSCHGIELVAPKIVARVSVKGQRTGSPSRILTEYVEREDWGGDMLDTGLELLNAADQSQA